MNAALKELIAAVVDNADDGGCSDDLIVTSKSAIEALAEFAKIEYDPIIVAIRNNEVEDVYNLPFGCALEVTIDVTGHHKRFQFEGE